MTVGLIAKFFTGATLSLLMLFLSTANTFARPGTSKQESLDEWRSLTTATARLPQAYVKGGNLRLYFQTDTNRVGFSAHWNRLRLAIPGYKAHFAPLRLDPKLSPLPQTERGWREATVIAEAEWRQLTTNLLAALTPKTPGHGMYYQGLLADRLLYRDQQGQPHTATLGQRTGEVVIERHYSMEETLETVARSIEEQLARSHPGDTLFLLLSPNARRFPQPLLLDCKRQQCVWLAPAALYDPTERGISLAVTAQGLEALLFESHGLALLKNPISSVARLGDLAVESLVRFLRFPIPRPGNHPPLVKHCRGMDLAQWEVWLDRYLNSTQKILTTVSFLPAGDFGRWL